MRVTERQQVDALLSALRDLRANIFERTEQISSGRRVNRPSDDPAAAERINQFRNVLRTAERRLLNVNEGVGRLNYSDGVLETVGNTVQRAKELAIQMRNDTNSATERFNTAQEVQQLLGSLAAIGNSQLNGRFIFAGSKTHTEPFIPETVTTAAHTNNIGGVSVSASVLDPTALRPDAYHIEFTSASAFNVVNLSTNEVISSNNPFPSGPLNFDGLSVTLGGAAPVAGDQFYVRVGYGYQGDGAAIEVEVGDSQTVVSNVAGDQVFTGPSHDLFATLQDFHQALLTNDVDGIETAIGQLDEALPQVTDARASIGARVNHLDTVKESLDLLTLNTQTLRSEFEDADLAKVASELTSLQTTLQGSLATLTRQFETSLLNFLR